MQAHFSHPFSHSADSIVSEVAGYCSIQLQIMLDTADAASPNVSLASMSTLGPLDAPSLFHLCQAPIACLSTAQLIAVDDFIHLLSL